MGYSYLHKHITRLVKKRDSHLVDILILQQQSQGLLQHIVGQGCEEPEPQTTHFRSGNLVEQFLSCAVQRYSYPWPCPAWDRAGPWWAQTWTMCSSMGSIKSSVCLASLRHCTPETNRISFWETAHQHGNCLFVLWVRVQRQPGCDQTVYRRSSIHHSYPIFSLCEVVGKVFGHYSLYHHRNPTVEHCEMVCMSQKV